MRKPGAKPSIEGTLRVVPLFPLPNVFLFPGCVMPLHIFEPRYRQMIEDQLDGPGQIVMGTVPSEHAADLEGAPPVRPVAGLGEIFRHERLPDGRFLIWLFGISRVRVHEAHWEAGSERPYRRVSIEPLRETAADREREPALRHSLREAIKSRSQGSAELPEKIPTSCLADLLLQRLTLPQERMEALYEELDVQKRAEAALIAHALHPVEHRPKRGKSSR